MPGFIVASPIYLDSSGYNPALDSHTEYGYPYSFTASSAPLNTGTKTDTQPIDEPGDAQSGNHLYAFVGDYYNRIHVTPSPLSLGNLVSSQERTVSVWNAYFSDQLLSAFDAVDSAGISVQEPAAAPTLFNALEQRDYIFNISLDGPPAIAATYTFTFPSDTIVLPVTGTRVLIFDISPDWNNAITERLEWRTDILRARNGSEQRVKLREHPRRSFEYSVLSRDGLRTYLEALLWGWGGRIYAIPVWTDKQRLQSTLTLGSSAIVLDTEGYDFYEGGLIILYGGLRDYETVEAVSVGAGTISLSNPTTREWPAGTRVMPVRLARLSGTHSINYATDTTGPLLLQWSVLENTSIPGVENTITYRGYGVLEWSKNWSSGLPVSYSRDMAEYETPTGRDPLFEDRSEIPQYAITRRYTMHTRELMHMYRSWLHFRQGRLVPVWVPSGREDLQLVATVGAAGVTVDVANVSYTLLINSVVGRRDLRIKHNDGTIWYRRIVGSVEIDADTERLTIDSSLGVEVDPGEVTLSFISLCCFEGDAVELRWPTDGFFDSTLRLRTVTDDV